MDWEDYTYIEEATGGSRGGDWNEPTRDSAEFLEKCGLNFEVETHPTHALIEGDGVTKEVPCEGAVGHFRRDPDGSLAYLATTGDGCPTFQNSEALDLLQAVCDEARAEPLKGGSKDDGSFCWLQARMPEVLEPLVGDAVEQYLTMYWGHGGKGSLCLGAYGNRIACLNMMKAVKANMRTSAFFKIRHTRNMKERVASALVGLQKCSAAFKEFGEVAKLMAGTTITDKQFESMLDVVEVGLSKVREAERRAANGHEYTILGDGCERSTRAGNIRDQISGLFHGEGQGSMMRGVYGTQWGAWQAVTEYTTHHRSTSGDGLVKASNREHSALFGSGATKTAETAQYLLSIAA